MKIIETRFAGIEKESEAAKSAKKTHTEAPKRREISDRFFSEVRQSPAKLASRGPHACRALKLKRKKSPAEAPKLREFRTGFTGLTGLGRGKREQEVRMRRKRRGAVRNEE
ncbi:MAG: hypothetical protein IJS32_09040 [Kiritimatiellae bacterium]|nr:hypothetical protein [Kiritimatiellia bacterium]